VSVVRLTVGIDDTDSPRGMCTTYVGAVVAEKLSGVGVKIEGLPRLIRLNPNCPWKTRGNCAISLTVEVEEDQIETVKILTKSTIEELAELREDQTHPGAVFLHGEPDAELQKFARRTVTELIELDEARRIIEKKGVEAITFKKGRGVIGALAAASYPLGNEATYELIAYRTKIFRGKERLIDPDSVFKMDRITSPYTFDNLDHSTGEIRITPHTPCPILYGIRAVSPEAALMAHNLVRVKEPIEKWAIFETNQATDHHYVLTRIGEIKPYTSVRVVGVVEEEPVIIPGGHVFFWIRDHTGKIRCAAYEPTRNFRWLVSRLIVGDVVEVWGGVKPKPSLPLTVNLERIRIVKLAPKVKRFPPRCPNCTTAMKSKGLTAGYVCEKCGEVSPPSAAILVEVDRGIQLGVYEVPSRSRRHLSKPFGLARVY